MINFVGLFDKQRELINDILQSESKYHIINASRQSSKSFSLSRLAVALGLTVEDDNILICSPTYEQVRIIFDNILRIKNIFSVIRSVKNSKPFEITLISGTRISFKSADRPDSLRGGSNRFVLLDEFAFFKDSVFETIIRPTTAAKKKSKIIVASTPKGKSNDFYKMAEIAMQGDVNYQYHTMHYSDNIYYDQSEVEDAKIRLPKNIFLQEYEAEFIDDGGDVFEGLDLVMILDLYKPFETGNRYFAGIDWGRASDDTVLTILNKDKEVIYQKDFQGDWDKQIIALSAILNVYKPIAYAESNGIGDPLLTALKQKYGNVREFVTSNSSKKEIIEQLRMDITTQSIKLPSKILSPNLYKQLGDYTYSMTKTGLITYHHREGGHDDYVDSLAIANYSYNSHNKAFKNVMVKPKSDFFGKRQSIY